MKRITISVTDAIAEKAARAVRRGDADNVSSYFADLAAREPDWELAGEAIDRMITAAGGISAADRQWALQSLGVSEDAVTGVSA